jgi:hypothetical protein
MAGLVNVELNSCLRWPETRVTIGSFAVTEIDNRVRNLVSRSPEPADRAEGPSDVGTD